MSKEPINGYEGDAHRMTDGPRVGEMILATHYGCTCGERHLGAFWQGYWARRREDRSRTATITYAVLDSELARRWGMDKDKNYTIALLGEALRNEKT